MPRTDRGRLAATVRRLAIGVAVLIVAGCGASASPSAPAASIAVVVTPSPSVAASQAAASPTAPPTPTLAPTVLTRPTDIPTDGTCEFPEPCLGLITPIAQHTQLFSPGFKFTIKAAGWENLGMSSGAVGLLRIAAPGDVIQFFAQPQATKPDGTLDFALPMTVAGIKAWLAANEALTVGPMSDVSIGGLHGVRTELEVAPGAISHPTDCPVQTCVSMFHGNTSNWDWGTISSERQRMYVLSAKSGVVLIFVDSLDGTTFDDLTAAADKILATVTFDKS
jgi:hypothetical protein